MRAPSSGLTPESGVHRSGSRSDNLGGDSFSDYLDLPGADVTWWTNHGFDVEVISTEFAFASSDDARRLLSRYLGRPVAAPPLVLEYRVGLFTSSV